MGLPRNRFPFHSLVSRDHQPGGYCHTDDGPPRMSSKKWVAGRKCFRDRWFNSFTFVLHIFNLYSWNPGVLRPSQRLRINFQEWRLGKCTKVRRQNHLSQRMPAYKKSLFTWMSRICSLTFVFFHPRGWHDCRQKPGLKATIVCVTPMDENKKTKDREPDPWIRRIDFLKLATGSPKTTLWDFPQGNRWLQLNIGIPPGGWWTFRSPPYFHFWTVRLTKNLHVNQDVQK